MEAGNAASFNAQLTRETEARAAGSSRPSTASWKRSGNLSSRSSSGEAVPGGGDTFASRERGDGEEGGSGDRHRRVSWAEDGRWRLAREGVRRRGEALLSSCLATSDSPTARGCAGGAGLEGSLNNDSNFALCAPPSHNTCALPFRRPPALLLNVRRYVRRRRTGG